MTFFMTKNKIKNKSIQYTVPFSPTKDQIEAYTSDYFWEI